MSSRDADECYATLRELGDELRVLLDAMPSADLGYPLTDPETCEELREALSHLQRAVDLLTQAVDREEPRYNALAKVIEEQRGATVN